jgi:hypothetical protein
VGERGAIENLMTLYTEALDDGAFDRLGNLFAHGRVTIEGGPHDGRTAHGRAAVADLYRAIVQLDPATGRTGTRHFITNFFVDIDDGESTATARSYFAVSQQTKTLPLQLVACGAYHDRYAKIDGHWTFTERLIICDQVGDLREHMR